MKESLVFEYKTIAQEIDVDAFAHLNNAQYLRLFEQARWDFISARGFDLKRMMELQEGPVILEVSMRFIKEVKPRDVLLIKSQTLSFDGKIGKVKQWMEREGKICAEAVFTFAYWSIRERKLKQPSAEWLHAIGYAGHES